MIETNISHKIEINKDSDNASIFIWFKDDADSINEALNIVNQLYITLTEYALKKTCNV